MSNDYIIYMILAYLLLFIMNLPSGHASSAQSGITPSQFKQDYYSLGWQTTYLTTSANYTSRGTSLDFDPDYEFGGFQSALYGRLDTSNHLSFFGELPLNYMSSENPVDSRSTFKLPGFLVGANFAHEIQFVKIISQISGYYALEKFDRSSDDALTSNGASYIDIGSHFFKNLSQTQLHGYISYQYRMEGFSSLVNYQLDLSYKLPTSTFTFGARGFQSATDDEHRNDPDFRHDFLDAVNGSSLMYAGVNPSRLDAFAQIKFAANDAVDFYGGVAKSIRGENSGDFLSFTFGLEYFFEPLSSKKSKRKHKVIEDDFEPEDEKEEIDPKVEEEIKTYNKPDPIKPVEKPAAPPVKKVIEKPAPKPVQPPAKKVIPKTIPKVVKPVPKPVAKPAPKATPKPIQKVKPKTIPQKSVVKPLQNKTGLEISKKQLGKKTTSTSPVKKNPKPKSKKVRRLKVDF